MIKKFKVTKGNGRTTLEDVAVEENLRLIVNDKVVADVKLSPGYEEEFAVGYCIGEGIIKNYDSISSIKVVGGTVTLQASENFDLLYGKKVSSDCMGGWRTGVVKENVAVDSDMKVKGSEILQGMRRLKKESIGWKKTGALHAVGIFGRGEFELVEDISRHVALDKIIGIALKKGIELENSYIVTSGRLPGDMVIKAAMANIPILASRTAPISSGIERAEKSNVTLIGFARGSRMNVYAHPERIIIDF